MAKEYKLNIKSLGGDSFLFICGLLALVALYSILTGKFPESVDLVTKSMGGIVAGIVMCVGLFVPIHSFLTEEVYYRIVYLPIEDFKVHVYDNIIIFAQGDHAWYFTYSIKKLAEKEKIRTIKYYDRKKKFISFDLRPYD